MLLEVRQHSGIPDNAVLSIRAGGARRQLPCSSIHSPLRFPCGPKDSVSFKVDVLDLIGTARFAYNPEVTEYTVDLDNPIEGGERINMQLVCALAASDDVNPEEIGLIGEKVGKKEDAAREYLEKHGLTAFMQFLMHSLMKDKPPDPYTYIQKQVTKRMVREVSKQVAGETFSVIDDKEIDDLLVNLHKTSSAATVSAAQLEELQREVAAAGEQLLADKERLRETTERLTSDATADTNEATAVPGRKVSFSSHMAVVSPLAKVGIDESPEVAIYREIARMQQEVSALARENTGLVMQISDVRQVGDTGGGAGIDNSGHPT